MCADAVNLIEIFRRFAELRGRQNISVGLCDNARAFAVIIHLFNLLGQNVQRQIQTGRADKFPVRFDGHAD